MRALGDLYDQARHEDELAKACYYVANFAAHTMCVGRRDALIELINQHPLNTSSRRAIASRVISGLSGYEDELKDGSEPKGSIEITEVIREIEVDAIEDDLVYNEGRPDQAYGLLRGRLNTFIQRLRTKSERAMM